MICDKTINIQIDNPITLQKNEEYILDISPFLDLYNQGIIFNGKLHIALSGFTGRATLCKKTAAGTLIEISSVIISNLAIYTFDISEYLVKREFLTHSLVLVNKPLLLFGVSITILSSSTSQSFYELNLNTFDTHSNLQSVTSNTIGQYSSYSFNFLTQEFLYKINLFEGLLPYDVSCMYSSILREWKLSLLDYIVSETDPNTNENYLVYVDKNNQQHRFNKISGVVNKFYSIDGTGLIIEKNKIAYTLKTELAAYPSKTFSVASGRIISINGKNSETITFTYGTNRTFITDYKGNTIAIDYSGNSIEISLNNSVYYVLTLSGNKITSISFNGKTDFFSYIGGLLSAISTRDNYSLHINRDNSLVSNLITKYDTTILENLFFEYEGLRTYITNRHGVKLLYGFDSNLKLINKGEVVDGETNELFVSGGASLVHDVSLSFNNPKGAIFRLNTSDYSFQLNQSSNDLETIIVRYKGNINNVQEKVYLKANKQYLLVATLKKEQDYSFTSTEKAWIDLYQDYDDENLIATLEFDPIAKSQTVVIPFTIPIDESHIPYEDDVFIKIRANNLYSHGGATISNVYILENKGKAVTFYRCRGGHSATGFDGLSWTKFNKEELVNDDYSFTDLIRNYINNEENNHLYWSSDLHNVTYNPNNSSSSSGGYILIGEHIIAHLNSNYFYGKKTLIKEYYENDILKQIFTFEYLVKASGQYIYNTLKYVGDDVAKSTKIYDSDFYLIREVDYRGNYTEYIYDSNHKVIKTISGNSNSDEVFINQYSYDSNRRLISESSLLSNSITQTSYSYINNLELLEKTTDSFNIDEEYEYSSQYEYESKISKGNSEINKNYSNESQSVISNDSEFIIEKDSTGSFGSFKVKNGVSTYKTIESMNRELFIDGDIVTYLDLTKGFFDKYDSLVHKSERVTFNNLPIPMTLDVYTSEYLYFDKKPDDIESDEQVDPPPRTSKAKLYKILDLSKYINYYLDYDDNGQISNYKAMSNQTTLFDFAFTYDELCRNSGLTLTLTTGNTFAISYTFFDKFSNDVSVIEFANNNSGTQYKSELSKDDLLRIGEIKYSFGSRYHRQEFNYYSLDVTENNEAIHLASSLVKQIDCYINGGFQESYLESEHLSYDVKGNIISLRKGTISTPNQNSGVSYQYDSNNRLISEDNKALRYTFTYQYDNNGNIISITKADSNNSVSTDVYGYDTYYKDLLVSFNNETILYNDYFEPVSIGSSISLTWKHGQLKSFVDTGSTPKNISFDYNHEGVRIKKLVIGGDSHEYITLGSKIIAEKITRSDDSIDYLKYVYGHLGIFGFFYNNNFYYLRRNALGDVTEIYNSQNLLVAKYVYDAWGNHKVLNYIGVELNYSTNSTHIGFINPFRYRGYYFDNETGLYYCVTRYYNPMWRRWLSPDKTEYFDPNHIDGVNLFAYCLNNPVMYTDEEGNEPEWMYWLVGALNILCAVGMTVISGGSAWPLLVGAIVGGVSAATFGGITINPDGTIFWDSKKAASNFMWGTTTGLIIGAFSMGISTVASYFGFSKFMSVTVQALYEGFACFVFDALKTLWDGSYYSETDVIISFVFGGFGTFTGSSVFRSVALGFSLEFVEWLIELLFGSD